MNNAAIANNRQWENWIDYAKAISIFMIVYCHSLNTSTAPFILAVINQWGCAFHVPVFFILSGFLFHVESSFILYLKKQF